MLEILFEKEDCLGFLLYCLVVLNFLVYVSLDVVVIIFWGFGVIFVVFDFCWGGFVFVIIVVEGKFVN